MRHTTIVVHHEQFMSEVVPRPAVDVPKPSKQLATSIQRELGNIFNRVDGGTPSEAILAPFMVECINKYQLCGAHVAAISRLGHASMDDRRAKMDVIIYPPDHLPPNDRPVWRHARMFMWFQRGGVRHDPFLGRGERYIEADALTQAQASEHFSAYLYGSFLYQHRTAVYALFINGPEFRAVRYARSGMIVTRPVDYVKNPAPLLELLCVFGQLDKEAQGMDPTATLLDEDSAAYKLMDEYAEDPGTDMDYVERTIIPPFVPTQPSAVPCTPPSTSCPTGLASLHSRPSSTLHQTDEQLAGYLAHDIDLDYVERPSDGEDTRVFKYVRERFQASLENGWLRYKLRVGPERRIFLVGKPTFCSRSQFGRGARGYIALDPRSRRFVYLKDCWRPFGSDVKLEGEYINELNGGKAAPYVPRLLCHGDVAAAQGFPTAPRPATGSKRTIDDVMETDRQTPYPKEDDRTASSDYRHYRIVYKDVCLDFISFVSSEQLVRFTYQCIVGHGYAYEDHNLLHRDVSSGNVLILPRLEDALESAGLPPGTKEVVWNGILTDWELAKVVPKDESNEKARQPERTGTWQFMSVYYVRHQAKLPVTVADDLESFFHVFLFYALRRLHHSIQPENVSTFISLYFDSYEPGPNKTRLCNKFKRDAITSGQLTYNDRNITFFTGGDRIYHDRVNVLIGILLEYFKARYKVLDWKKNGNFQHRNGFAVRKTSKAPSVSPRPIKRLAPHRSLGGPKGDVVVKPSKQDETYAEELKTHTTIQGVFESVLCDEPDLLDWPTSGDVVQVRLPDSYEPRDYLRAFELMVVTAYRSTADNYPVATQDGELQRLPKRSRTTTNSDVDVSQVGASNAAHTTGYSGPSAI
ncbi:hypothetical protein BD413DRAFT_675011 [Trametes elegans]|nr:hypothetical protein BD413DRAFT_675011 [Trametes elegans]